ncbi:hypothetical protein ACOMHN_007516 [Nucella lapillus]
MPLFLRRSIFLHGAAVFETQTYYPQTHRTQLTTTSPHPAMAKPRSLEDLIEELSPLCSADRFQDVYRDLGATDQEFPDLVEWICGLPVPRSKVIYCDVLYAECANIPRVKQAFRVALTNRLSLCVQEGCIRMDSCLKADGADFPGCLCHLLMTEAVRVDRVTFLLETFWSFVDGWDRMAGWLPCMLHTLAASLAGLLEVGVGISPAELNDWFLNKCGCEGELELGGELEMSFFTRPHTLERSRHFNGSLHCREMSVLVDNCLNDGYYCVALYLLHLRMDYAGVAQFVDNFKLTRQADKRFLRFMAKLALHVIVREDRDTVLFAMFSLCQAHGDSTFLENMLKSELVYRDSRVPWPRCVKVPGTLWEDLNVDRSGLRHAIAQRLDTKEWSRVVRLLQWHPHAELVDFALSNRAIRGHNWPSAKRLFDRSSKSSPVTAHLLTHALREGDVVMVEKLIDNCRQFVPDVFFQNWPSTFGASRFMGQTATPQLELLGMSVARVFVRGGFLCQLRLWIERNLQPCSKPPCRGCRHCYFLPLHAFLERGMADLAKMLLDSGCLPDRVVRRLLQDPWLKTKLKAKKQRQSLEVLEGLDHSPRPLLQLCCRHISALMGCGAERRERIEALGVPKYYKQLIAFGHV